jgi:hypothetical protein
LGGVETPKKTRKETIMDKPDTYPKILLGRPPLTVSELFINRSRWAQGSDGKDAQGNTNTGSAFHPNAVRWCLGGALHLVYGHNPELREAMTKLVLDWLIERREEDEEPDEISIAGWNDQPDRTFKDIRKLLSETKI